MEKITVYFPIVTTIDWVLHKTSLREELMVRAADHPACPASIKESAYTGDVAVSPSCFVVCLTKGDQ